MSAKRNVPVSFGRPGAQIGVQFDYQLGEHYFGANWFDGKPLFRNVIVFGQMPAIGTATQATGLGVDEVDQMLPIEAIAGDGTGDFFSLNTIANNGASVDYSKGDLNVSVGSDLSAFTLIVILYYTKR